MAIDKNAKREELKKRIYSLNLSIIKFLKTVKYDIISKNVVDQVFRSSTSVLANLIEAQYSSSKKEFISYLQICLRSSKESIMWFCMLRDSGIVTENQVRFFINELDELSKIFTSSLITLRRSKQAGIN